MTRVGVTGHQYLEAEVDWTWVAGAMREQLTKVEPPLMGVTSLAIGADQLLARLVLDLGGTIQAVLPFVERSLSADEVHSYRELVRHATVEVLQVQGSDEDCYLAAGHRVVELSDLMLAVWDGAPAKGKGGTADVVGYAIRRGVPLIQINPVSRVVSGPQGR